ncbi:MAG: GMC family oxidoreductase [Myxococcales bacterium]|nr:GMC family oxidoreductase [Myxococcales bacterium]
MASIPQGVYTRDHWPAVGGTAGGLRKRWWGGYEVELRADVIIIGSGAGGGVMAAELAEGGLDVLVLEEGGYHGTEEFTADGAAMARKLYRDGGLTFALGTPPVMFSEGRCVGGSTTINGGMSWRTPDMILERWRREDGISDATPDKMARYFERVESFISARLNDPETLGRDNELLKQGADKKGWRIIQNIRNTVHCAGSNNCAFGCPTGAKQSTLVSYLPRALRFGARVYADCRVDKLLLDERENRARGVSGRVIESNGQPSHRFVAHAPVVVVCCGSVQTPALLARSGLKSPSGQLGHNLALHPNAKLVALFDEDVEAYKGAHQFYQVREFQEQGIGVLTAINVPPGIIAMSMPMYGERLGALMRDYQRMVIAGCLIEDSVTGRVRVTPGGKPVCTYQLARRDAQQAVRAMSLLSELMFTAGAKRIILPFEGVPELTSIDDVRWLRNQHIGRESMELLTVHMMGTARMGDDPRRHVCDPRGQLYGARGVYLADASVFPSPIGVNPMETVMTLATRSAEKLLRDHQSGRLLS